MKKTLTLSLIVSSLFIASSALAYDETRDDGFEDPTKSRLGAIYNQAELKKAVKLRYHSYLRNKARTNASKNIKSQYYRHIASRAAANVNQKSTFLDRTGELKDVPYYSQIRANSSLNTTVPNNPKRNFRVRAYDYYVQGGEAGEEALTKDVINGETHRVKRSFYNNSGNASYADILSQVRAMQRNTISNEKVPTGHQSSTTRIGDWRRNLAHPYMFRSKEQ